VPRPIWTGAISFGLVNVPVKLYSAVTSKDVRFHQLEASTNARVRQRRVSSATGEEVGYDDIVKGYELRPDTYVTVSPEELSSLDPPSTRAVDIADFVDLSDIDPVYFERPYYLVPDRGGAKAYALLRDAMAETGKIGIGRLVLRTKEYLAAIRPRGDVLVLETLYYGDEVNPTTELELPGDEVEVSDREVAMARQLIDTLASDFDPDRYHDTYRERVLELIERKAEGQEIVVEEPTEEPARVVDLMAALEASLARAQGGGEADEDRADEDRADDDRADAAEAG